MIMIIIIIISPHMPSCRVLPVPPSAFYAMIVEPVDAVTVLPQCCHSNKHVTNK